MAGKPTVLGVGRVAPRQARTNGQLDSTQMLAALKDLKHGDFTVRLPAGQPGIAGEVAEAFNAVVELIGQRRRHNRSQLRHADRPENQQAERMRAQHRKDLRGVVGQSAEGTKQRRLLSQAGGSRDFDVTACGVHWTDTV
jgi:methyl-accepting chemotaxis protein